MIISVYRLQTIRLLKAGAVTLLAKCSQKPNSAHSSKISLIIASTICSLQCS